MKKNEIASIFGCGVGLNYLLKMKLTLIFLLALFMQVSASVYSQSSKFSFDYSNKQIVDILEEIEDNSDFRFFYQNEQIDVQQTVNINIVDEPIEALLEQLFKNQGINYKLLDDNLIVLTPARKLGSISNLNDTNEILNEQQPNSVTGKVTGSDGEPIPGVTVIIVGTSNGTITDFSGEYIINDVSADAILQFSFVGMKSQEITVNNQSIINVTLEEETIGIEEVVAIGYGVQKKSQLTGSITSVKTEDMENRVVTDPTVSLQGKTSGVQIFVSSGQPGTIGKVRVRGLGSNSNNEPLYIVDGTQVTDISHINSNDIESMEILKDASAAAIYGARAGNGVVLVTTKKGSAGAGNINYNFMYSIQSNNNVPTMLNAQQFYDYQLQLASSNQSALDADWGDKTTDTNWLDKMFTTGRLQNHSLSMSGGTEKVTYYTGFSANINDGPVIGQKDKYERYTGTFNTDYNVKDWLKITTNNQVTYSRTYGGAEVFEAAMHFSPLIPTTVETPSTHMQSYIDQGYPLIQDKDGNYPTLPVFSSGDDANPYVTLNRTSAWTKNTSLIGTTSAILTPIEGLAITSRFGYTLSGFRSYSFDKPGIYTSQSASYNATVSATSRNIMNYQWENFANYSKSFGKHNLTFMAGMSFIERQIYDVSGSVTGNDQEYGFVGMGDLYAYFAYKSGSSSQSISGGEEVIEREMSYYGRINYDYENKYILQASIRADAADLAKLPQSGRWGYFPAASAGWTISNESFMEDFSAISHLKLRTSWGQNGSTAGLGSYAWQSVIGLKNMVYPFIADEMNYVTAKEPTTAGNKELKWETSEQFDIGLDIRLAKDRFAFTYDWYQKTTKDLILTNITQSYLVGVAASPFNAGKVVNHGHEFDLSWRDNVGSDFNYSISTNFTTLKNEVKEITNALTYIEGRAIDSSTLTWFEQGYPMWHFRTYKYTGVDENGNPTFLDANENGTLDSDDKVDCGSGIPKYNFGITITADWKNFDLTIFGSGQGGNKIFQYVTRAFNLNNNVPAYLLEDAWTPENTNTDIPKVGMENIGYYYVSDAQLFKGDYFKLKQLQVGYTLPSSLTGKWNIDKLRFYVSGENLFTITNYPGFDPEIMSSGSNIGVDTGSYPNNRNLIVGLNLTF